MDNQHKVHGDEDAHLMDVPISFVTPQKANVEDSMVSFNFKKFL